MELKELYYNYNFNYGTISVIDRFYTVKLYVRRKLFAENIRK